jgi:spermidine/putrescine transport system substrate-binding protein
MDDKRQILDKFLNTDPTLLSRREFLKLASVAALAAGVSMVGVGCSPQSQASKKIGGTIKMCLWEGYDDKNASKPFIDQYNVQLQGTYISINEDCFPKEKASPGTFDTIAINLTFCDTFYSAGLLQPIDTSIVKTLPDIIDTLRNQPPINHEGKAWLVPYIWGVTSVSYNPKYVELTDPFEFKDIIFDDKYKGKIITMDDPAGMMNMMGILNGIYKDVNLISREQLKKHIETGKEVKKRLLSIVSSFSDVTDILSRGDAWICLTGWEAVTKWASDKGVTLAYKYPTHSWSWSDGWMVTKAAQNPVTAFAYINHMTSPESVSKTTEDMYCAPANQKAFDFLSDTTKKMFSLERLKTALANAPINPLPPEKSDQYATNAETQAAWEEIKNS